MTRRPRAAVTAALLTVWLALWLAAWRAGLHPQPLSLLAAVLLVTSLAALVHALVRSSRVLPPSRLRITPLNPWGQDQHWQRYQQRLEDATASRPSSGPVLGTLADVACERLRLVSRDADRTDPTIDAPRLSDRLTALIDARPADRTRMSPAELTRLVEDLESLGVPRSAHARPLGPSGRRDVRRKDASAP